jgi:NADH:ubiquinone oxidoreductase subunit 3 (subunit A)
MGNNLLLSPPLTFIVILGAVLCLSAVLRKLAFRPQKQSEGLTKPYACGEDIKDVMIQPDYSQFFPFVYYFTILHVVALMIAAIPAGTIETFLIAIIYIVCAVVGLLVLYRR